MKGIKLTSFKMLRLQYRAVEDDNPEGKLMFSGKKTPKNIQNPVDVKMRAVRLDQWSKVQYTENWNV